MGLAKILLFIFNFIFVILGIAVIVSGILIFTSDKDFDVLIEDSSLQFFSVGGLTIALGVIIFIVAFCGCCGAIKENKCLLTVFIILLVIILAVEVVVVILGYLYQGQVDVKISDAIKAGMKQYTNDDVKSLYKEVWDSVQEKERCCGVDNANDWQKYGDFNGTSRVPQSCCEKPANGNVVNCTTTNAFIEGCKEIFTAPTKSSLIFAGTAAIIIVLAEIFGIMFACCVIKDAGKDGKGQYA